MATESFQGRLSRFVMLLVAVLLVGVPGVSLGAEHAAGTPMTTAEMAKQATQQSADKHRIEALADGRARIPSPLQAMEATAAPDGITVVSTVKGEPGTFAIRPASLGRAGNKGTALRPGKVSVDGQLARIARPGLVEELTTSADGVRQDFVVAAAPQGKGDLVLELEVTGALLDRSGDATRLTLESSRELLYHRLLVTDSSGKIFPARFELFGPERLRIVVADAGAAYPLRIDPTITDADWVSLALPDVNIFVYAVQPAGANIYVAGDFKGIRGINAKYIAKWDGSSWSALGSETDSPVYALAWDGTNLYAGGVFSNAGGTSANCIAKWDGSSWSALGSGMIGNVTALAWGGTSLYAGGSFTSAGGTSANYIAKWNGSSWSALGSGMDNPVSALLYAGTTLYAGGSFTSAGGNFVNYIAKWNGSSWSAMGGMNNPVCALAWDGTNLYAGGSFTTAGGISANYIARWNGSGWSPLGSGMYYNVYALAWDGTNLYAGGYFTYGGGTSATYKWNGSSWSTVGGGISGIRGSGTYVRALAWDGTSLYVGGNFTTAGETSAPSIAKWNDSSWSSMGNSAMNGDVYALTWDGTNLYAGGSFTTAGGNIANFIAKWNGSSWSALGSGMENSVNAMAWDGTNLYAGGKFFSSGGTSSNRIAKWNGSSWSPLGSGMNTDVNALIWDGTNLYAGGRFTTAGGTSANHIAQWNGSSWSALGSGVNSDVNALVWDGTNLYAGGLFTTAGGTSANRIAKWNGSGWSTLGSGMNDYVTALAWSGTNLYAGGGFTTAGGASVNRIAKWNGSSWSALGSGMNVSVSALAWDGANLYAGGGFTIAGGGSANNIAKWNGSSWFPLGSGTSGGVLALATNGTKLYVGGAFGTAGGVAARVASVNIGRTVTATATGANGTLTSTNPLTVVADATASFTVSPNATYQPSATVTGDCPSGFWNGNQYTTGAITADCTVGFSFTKITYPLTLSTTGSGAVTAAATGYSDQTCSGSCGYSYDINTVVTLTPNPGSGYTFTGWSGACSGTGSCSVTMNQVQNVTASFVDTAPPVTTPSSVSGTYNSNQNVTLTCSDGPGSGCAGTYYCLGTGCTPTTPYVAAIPIASSQALRFYSKDSASNSEAIQTATYVIDTNPPVTTVSPWMGTYRDAQNVTLTCNDGSGSGCAATYYCLGSGCTPTTPYSGPVSIAASTELRFYSTDVAGKSEQVRTYSYTIDPTLAYRFERLWPQLAQPKYFNAPYGVVVDAGSNIYVADTNYHRIQKFDSSGNFLIQWGTYGSGDGQFNNPQSLALDASGNVYVADTSNHRIQKFDSSGNYLTQWGTYGSGNGQLIGPTGVAVDAGGNVYVTEFNNNRIQKFDTNGNYLTQWGTYGSGNGQFSYPRGITVDTDGNVYVADTTNSRIQKFTSSGTYLSKWGTYGSGNGQFVYPYGVAVDTSGNLYVADTSNSRIQKFDSNGTYLNKWGTNGRSNGQLLFPRGVTVDAGGNVLVADTSNNRIQKFDSNGNYLNQLSPFGSSDGLLSGPGDVVVDASGNVYVADGGKSSILKFDSNGTYLSQWGTNGSGSGQLAVDTSGNIYVADTYNHRIQKFTGSGMYLAQWGTYGTDNGQFNYPEGVTVDASGNIYVVDTRNHRIQKFDGSGNFLTQWGTYGSGNGQFNSPTHATVDASGNIYVVDASNQRIQKFDSSGTYMTQWGTYGITKGQFSYPFGVAVDSGGNVYITDAGSSRIQKFDSNGTYLTQWGILGSGNGQFNSPYGVAVDASGNIYVVDGGNNRIQKFNLAVSVAGAPTGVSAIAENGQAVVSFTPPVSDGGSAILFYTATSSPGNISASGSGSPITVNGITYGIAYTFTVTASNAAGAGAPSTASNSVVSPLTAPGVPTGVTAAAGNGQATVMFNAPASNGGSPIISYTVTSNPGGITAIGTASPIMFTGLTNDVSYTFTVSATNAMGTGPASIPSAAIIPDGTAPVTVATPSRGNYNVPQTVTLSCSDGSGTGCVGTWYCLGTGCTPTTLYSGAIAISSSTDLRFYSTDVVGNSEEVNTATFNIDCSAGTCPDLIATGEFWSGASINSLGEVVWSQYDQASHNTQLFSSTRGQLTNDQAYHDYPAINNLGDLVWVDNGTIRGNIAGQPIVVTSGQNWIGMIDINDRGEVVWPQDGGGSNIYSNLRGQLTSDATGHYEPAINNQGDVVFIQSEQVYKLAAGSSTPVQVTNNGFWHYSPAINDSGEIVWLEQDTSSSPRTNRIVSSTRGTLLTAIVDIYSVDLNNCGDIIYITSENSQSKLYRLGSNAPCVSYPGTNDILTQATPVAFGGIFTGLIDSVANPVDWYRFDAASGDSIHLTVNFDNRSPNVLNIGLYDGQGNLLSGPTAASPLGIVTTAAYSGAYYLKLEGQGGRFGYSVSLSKSSTNCGAGPCPDLIATGEFWSGASINSLGEVVWSQYDQAIHKTQLFSSTRGQLTNDEAYHEYPAINNLGDLVWWDGSTSNVKGLIAGQSVTVTTTNAGGRIDINDRGEVVWSQYDALNKTQIYSNLRGQLTNDATGHYDPAINSQGDVVFTQSDPAGWQVYKLAAGSSTPVQVTNNAFWHYSPAINDSGEIVWVEQDTSSSPRTTRIVSSTRGTLLTGIVDIYSVDLNNCGDIAYITWENSQKLYRLGSNAPCVSYPGTNDILTQATPVAFGGIFTGLIDSVANPVDWYRFDAASGDSIHLTVNFDNRSPNVLNIGLYDGQGNILSGPTATNPLGIVTTAAYSGAYYLKLEGQGGRFGYSVSLSKYTNNCGAGPCPEIVATGEFWSGVSINSLGEVVWSQYDQAIHKTQLFSSTRGQLTNDEAYHEYPAINNLGDIVWSDGSIKGLIAGQSVTVATTNVGGRIDINDRGEVVWSQYDALNKTQIYSNLRGQLTNDATDHYDPAINSQGDVVFTQSDPAGWQVYKLAAGSSTPVQVTNNAFWHYSPAINDSGEIVWVEQDTSSSPRTTRIVSSARGTLLTGIVDIYSVDLNNCGDIAYITWENSQKLYRLGSNAPCVSYPGTNDILTQATSVSFGDIFTGLIDSAANPVDWYRFDAMSGDNIHLTVNYDNRSPNVLNIGLYDGQGNLLSGPTSASPLGIHTQAGYSGSYYLKLESSGGRFGYSVSLSKYTSNCGAGPCPDLIATDQLLGGSSINSLGEVVWSQYDQASGYNQIYSSSRGQLTNDQTNHISPAINNLGDLVWVEDNKTIHGNIAGQPVVVTSGQNWMSRIDINDRGELIWEQIDQTGHSYTYSNLRGQLTSDTFSFSDPSINNLGDVVFTQYDLGRGSGPGQIYKLAAGSVTPVAVTSDGFDHYGAAINDSGEIIWGQQDTANPNSFYQVASNTRGVLVSAAKIWRGVDLNNCGDIVYTSYESGQNQNKLYRLGSNAPCFPSLPVAQASPSSLSFGSLATNGSSALQTVTLSNSGTVSLAVSGITLTGSDPGQFTVATGTCLSLTPTIAAGGNCTVNVTFAPTSTGAKSASLLIASNDPVNQSLAVALSGTGLSLQYALAVDHSGTGNGMVNTSPGIDVACAVGNCTRSYDQGAQITVTASPDASSVFTGWSGACSGTGSCSVTMNGDNSVTATFDQASAKNGSISYSSIAAIYAAAAGGETFKLFGTSLLEALDFNRTITIVLEGGYNAGFTSRTGGTTTIKGLTISSGTVIIDGIIIQ